MCCLLFFFILIYVYGCCGFSLTNMGKETYMRADCRDILFHVCINVSLQTAGQSVFAAITEHAYGCTAAALEQEGIGF